MKRIFLLSFLLWTGMLFSQESAPFKHYENLAGSIRLNLINKPVEQDIINLQPSEHRTVIGDIGNFQKAEETGFTLSDYILDVVKKPLSDLYIAEKKVDDYIYTFIASKELEITESREILVQTVSYTQSSKRLVLYVTQVKELKKITERDRYQHIIDKTLIDLYEYSVKMDSEDHKNVINVTISHYLKGELPFYIDDKESSLLSSAHFIYHEEGDKPHIELKENIFKLYDTYKSLFQGILFHELFHAYIFFMHTEYLISVKDNEVEKYFFEMDALNIESRFFSYIAAEENKQMTPFENFMIESFKEDNLAGVSFLLKAKDMSLLYYLSGLTEQYYKGEITRAQLLNEVIQVGQYILTLKQDQEDEWSRYKVVCSLLSFSQHIATFLNPVLSDVTDNTFEEQIQAINSIKDVIDKNYEAYSIYINEKNSAYIAGMEPVLTQE